MIQVDFGDIGSLRKIVPGTSISPFLKICGDDLLSEVGYYATKKQHHPLGGADMGHTDGTFCHGSFCVSLDGCVLIAQIF
jgi:hypothetical protein